MTEPHIYESERGDGLGNCRNCGNDLRHFIHHPSVFKSENERLDWLEKYARIIIHLPDLEYPIELVPYANKTFPHGGLRGAIEHAERRRRKHEAALPFCGAVINHGATYSVCQKAKGHTGDHSGEMTVGADE